MMPVRISAPTSQVDLEPIAVYVPVMWPSDFAGRVTIRDSLTRRAVRPPASGAKTIGGRLHLPGTAIDREGPFYLVELAGGMRCWVWAAEAKQIAMGSRCNFAGN